jgi:glycosyltransferase involved in cell wall biosynthesis
VVFNKSEATRLSEFNKNCHRSQSWFDDSTFNFAPASAKNIANPLKVIWVGRLESQKNPMLAVDVAKYLDKKGLNFDLQIIGSGSLRNDLQRSVAELGLVSRVRLVGSKGRLDIANQMGQSDCLILTSHSEGSAVVLAEAASTGLASVVSVSGDPDDFIQDGINGYRVEADTPEQFALAILKCGGLNKTEVTNTAQPRSRSSILPRIEALLLRVS